jgi:hypothetical protein
LCWSLIPGTEKLPPQDRFVFAGYRQNGVKFQQSIASNFPNKGNRNGFT